MNKKVLHTVLLIGVLLVVASVVIPLVIALAANPAANPNTSIIGGADAPTLLLFMQSFRSFSWLTLVGIAMTVASLVALAVRKK